MHPHFVILFRSFPCLASYCFGVCTLRLGGSFEIAFECISKASFMTLLYQFPLFKIL